jgi:dihydroorotase
VPGEKGVMENLKWMNAELAAKTAVENKPAVVGIGVVLHDYLTGPDDLEILKRALEAAEASHLPLMAHIDQSYSPLPDILKMLRKGDVFTLCFTNHQHGFLDANGKIVPEVWEARRRGIIFDVGHSTVRFSFEVAEKCLQQGFPPDTISTDLGNANVNGPVFDLPTVISKFMAIGMDLEKAIELTTINPARVFDYGLDLGTLRPGGEADIGIFELYEGNFEFVDGVGAKRAGRQKLINKAAVCRGKLFVNQT